MPAVTEVVDAVAATREVPPERRAELFRAAQQVCAEELRLARTGFAPASLAELAERAVRLLPPDLGGDRIPVRGWFEEAPFPEEIPVEAPASMPDDVFDLEGESPLRGAVPPEDAAEEEDVPAGAAPNLEEEPEEEAEEEIAFATVDRPGPPARGGKLATILVLAAIAGGVWFFARTKKAPAPAPAPAEAEAPAAPAPAPPSPPPARTPVPAGKLSPTPAPPASAAEPAAPNAPAIPESRGSSIVSPDWAGHPPVWMIHFSSYQKKENADRDAARLGKLLGRPLRILQVNLGAQGLWYRVLLGDYASREEAQAGRDALAATGTPGIGLVYRVEGAPPARGEAAPAR